MRFLMLMYPNNPDAEAGAMPSAEAMGAMMKYNEELAKAGVLLSLDGLHPSSKGARVRFAGGQARVTDGPFSETKEIIGGFWLLDLRSRDEAIEWARRCPADDGNMIEVRQVFEMSDFPADLQAAVDSSTVTAALEQQQRRP